MRCLILGGGGFIGSNLAEALLSEGYRVRIFERPHSQTQIHPKLIRQLEWMEGDFSNPAEVDAALHECDIVFHLISTTLPKSSNENPIYDVESNLVATLGMLESARKHGVKKVIFTSSGGTVYGIPSVTPISETHPTEPIVSYGITKLAIEKYLYLFHMLHGLDYCVLRIANPYGKGQRVIANQGAIAVFLYKALHNETIEIWGDGSVTRDYVHISDVVAAMLSALNYSGNQRTFNIGSGIGITLNEILHQIELACGHTVKRIYLPGRQFDVPCNVLNIDRARESLNWQPKISFSQGIKETIDWIR